MTVTRNAAHDYFEDGLGPYPSVTTAINATVAKTPLIAHARRRAIEYTVDNLDDARTLIRTDTKGYADYLEVGATQDAQREAMLGDRVHTAIERYIKERLRQTELGWGNAEITPIPGMLGGEEIAYQISEFRKFERLRKVRWIASELPLVSRRLGVGGTVDAIGWMDHQGAEFLTVFDFKTGRRSLLEHVMQLAAYTEMLRESRPDLVAGNPLRAGILHLAAGEPYYFRPFTLTHEDYEAFHRALEQHKYLSTRTI